MDRGKEIILYATLSLAGIFFFFYGLVMAKPFLAPLLTAMVLAFLLLPLSVHLERWE